MKKVAQEIVDYTTGTLLFVAIAGGVLMILAGVVGAISTAAA